MPAHRAFPVYFERRIHGRHLGISPLKRKDRPAHLFFRKMLRVRDSQGFPGGILSVRGPAKEKYGLIGFSFSVRRSHSLVAFPRHTGSTPSASGSRVPVWPIFFWPMIPLSFATTSWEVYPFSLYTFRIPCTITLLLPLLPKAVLPSALPDCSERHEAFPPWKTGCLCVAAAAKVGCDPAYIHLFLGS